MSTIGEMTAETIAISQLTRHTHKASIEKVEDEDDAKIRTKKTLPANGQYMLMTESEYMEDMNCSEREENDTMNVKFAFKVEEK